MLLERQGLSPLCLPVSPRALAGLLGVPDPRVDAKSYFHRCPLGLG